MVGWHHKLNRHESEQTLGYSEGQGSLACCSIWGWKELDMADQLNNKKIGNYLLHLQHTSQRKNPFKMVPDS